MTTRPKKALGQHFLVDENLLGVIGRHARLQPDDVVLEVGPGTGVLTRYLAARVRLVHAVELDRSLDESLREALAGAENVNVVFGDAVTFEYASLDPPPAKLVANLPYNVATPIVLESLDGIPSLERWVVMVQREVADRFFAKPRTKAYGSVSVLLQLQARRTGFHRVPPTAFRPRPRVESAIVAFERRARCALARARAPRRRGVVRTPEEDARQLGRACRARDALGRREGARYGRTLCGESS